MVNLHKTSVSTAALGVALAFSATSVSAQIAPTPVEDLADEEASLVTEPADSVQPEQPMIVITGSRVRTSTFTTDSPVDVIGREDVVLAGTSTTADVLQSSTVTSGTSQIDEGYLGFLSPGGQAANSVGLRGFGPARTLVLLNGRRISPAGTGAELISADLNVLPAAVIDQVQVLRSGASSVYGSDAIAGVINVITETDFDGITVDLFTNQPLEASNGERYRASITAGKTFDRGHLLGSLEYYKSEGLRVSDRDEFTCPQDLLTDRATGELVGQLDPTKSFVRCFPFETGGLGTAQNYLLGYGIFTGVGVNRFTYQGGDIDDLLLVNDYDLRPLASERQLGAHVISPLETYTGYLNGAIEVNDNVELYGEALFSRRESYQESTWQISIDPNQLGFEIYGGPIIEAYYPAYASPFFPDSVAADGYEVLRVFIVPPNRTFRQEVDFFRINGGLRGDLGLGDFRYDANLQFGWTESKSTFNNIRTDRFANSLSTAAANSSVPSEYIVTPLAGQAGAGQPFTCASNLDASGNFIAGSECIPINIFAPNVLRGDIDQATLDYLAPLNIDRSKYDQFIASLIVDGSLFELPDGPVGVVLGTEFRRDNLKDTPSLDRQNQNLYNYSSIGVTQGSDEVIEVFGEVRVPLLANRPLAEELTLTGSARYTDYESYGSDWTYKIGGVYAPTSFLRFRGSYNTSFRAPNLFELYAADQIGFLNGGVDPCNDFANGGSPGETLYDNCFSELSGFLNSDLDMDGTFDNWVATGGPEVTTTGGAGILEAERSESWNLGGVLDLDFAAGSLSLAVDYFDISLTDQVNQLTTSSILDFCYEAEDFRQASNQYCSLIEPRETSQGNLQNIRNSFLNISRQSAEGIDFSTRLETDLIAGNPLVVNARATYMLSQTFAQFDADPDFDYVGLLGFAAARGGPEWTGSLDVRYDISDFTIRYGVEYVGEMDSNVFNDPDVTFRGMLVDVDLVAEEYWEHALSVQYEWNDIAKLTVGVRNLFDTEPSVVGENTEGNLSNTYPRIGNYFAFSGYDFYGRQVFVNLTSKF